jgi:hydrogenase expression/formation protein HypE
MERIGLDHGSGGDASPELLQQICLTPLDNEYLRPRDERAVLAPPECILAMTTDSYIVDPIFFPGGNMGSLAAHGTAHSFHIDGRTPTQDLLIPGTTRSTYQGVVRVRGRRS